MNEGDKYKNKFLEDDFVYVKNFIDTETITTVSKYLENVVAQRRYVDDEFTKIAIYSDPLLEIILQNSVLSMEYISEKELYPTYSYGRIYVGQEDLSCHTDRESCEYTATINVASVGDPWPIAMKNKQGKTKKFVLKPGDAVIYKGCEVSHWRDKAINTEGHINVQFMLHYVDKNGPFSRHKYDGRTKLGLPKITERPLCL